MRIKSITEEDLRAMENKQGLILQGCGGNLTDWLNGINNMLTEAGILKNGTSFPEVSAFNHKGSTCLLFPVDEKVSLDMGKLAIWRIKTSGTFGSTWLTDFVDQQLGGFSRDQPQQNKPDCPLIGQDSNIFNLLGLASRTLRENGMADQSRQMYARVTQSQSYDSALSIIGEYVNITSVDDMNDSMTEGMVM